MEVTHQQAFARFKYVADALPNLVNFTDDIIIGELSKTYLALLESSYSVIKDYLSSKIPDSPIVIKREEVSASVEDDASVVICSEEDIIEEPVPEKSIIKQCDLYDPQVNKDLQHFFTLPENVQKDYVEEAHRLWVHTRDWCIDAGIYDVTEELEFDNELDKSIATSTINGSSGANPIKSSLVHLAKLINPKLYFPRQTRKTSVIIKDLILVPMPFTPEPHNQNLLRGGFLSNGRNASSWDLGSVKIPEKINGAINFKHERVNRRDLPTFYNPKFKSNEKNPSSQCDGLPIHVIDNGMPYKGYRMEGWQFILGYQYGTKIANIHYHHDVSFSHNVSSNLRCATLSEIVAMITARNKSPERL